MPNFFTVADAKNGFWHVPLDDESSYLTTFGTPWSRYRWTRMPFGISPAPEEFQRRLDNALQGLDGVCQSSMISWSSVRATLKLKRWRTMMQSWEPWCSAAVRRVSSSTKRSLSSAAKKCRSWATSSPLTAWRLILPRSKAYRKYQPRAASKTWNVSSVWPTTCNGSPRICRKLQHHFAIF